MCTGSCQSLDRFAGGRKALRPYEHPTSCADVTGQEHLPEGVGDGLWGDNLRGGLGPGERRSPTAGTQCPLTVGPEEGFLVAERTGGAWVCGDSSREDSVSIAWGSSQLGSADGGLDSGSFEIAPRPAAPSSPTVLQEGT